VKLKNSILIAVFSTPLFLFLIPTFLSIMAFLVPMDFYGRIWRNPSSEVPIEGLLFAIMWNVEVAGAIFFGSVLGNTKKIKKLDYITFGKKERLIFRSLSALAAVGTAATYYMISKTIGLSAIGDLMSSGVANTMKEALYQNYSIGILSLRYLAIMTGGMSAFLLFYTIERKIILIFNLIILLAEIMISSRLSLIAGFIVFLGLVARYNSRIPVRNIVFAIILVFTILTISNSSRNKNYYGELGIQNPILQNISEMFSYLASPIQGQLTAGLIIATGNQNIQTGIDPSLQTNSAFLGLAQVYNIFIVFVVAPLALLMFSFFYVINYCSKNFLKVAGALSWGYAFCELWRILLFTAGIFYILLFFGLFYIGIFYTNTFEAFLKLLKRRLNAF
jgi:hypothetical protein